MKHDECMLFVKKGPVIRDCSVGWLVGWLDDDNYSENVCVSWLRFSPSSRQLSCWVCTLRAIHEKSKALYYWRGIPTCDGITRYHVPGGYHGMI